MSRPFRQVDVFGSGPFTGNPLAVVLDADGLTTEEMQRISAWTNLSECTFVLPPTTEGADYRVRIFSLTTELPFAGHPTLGTARAWLEAGGVPHESGRIVQECGIGLVTVRDGGDHLAFAAPPLLRSGPVSPEHLVDVAAVLGVAVDEVVEARWIDNGPGWVGVLLRDAAAVLALEPDGARRPGGWAIGVVGAHGAGAADGDAAGSDAAIEVRAFFTDGLGPLIEDPVTGSLNASVAQWLLETGRLEAPYTAAQGTRVGRRGRVRVTRDAGGVWIGGASVVAISGEITTT
ncbi:phenazine biosynthesis protein PhzF [Serinibacter arcticus]|uniref:Phenazine biosynthesis protein PhzF n=1 Tax=Serinibacter arcticus TaxID=1655435 RepID=A0A2U1ZVV2_9MICO|nr:PhzF family phenazine biosynthesis protein [Serinibacter arcticus]PWD51052.1 phenazine biosynthesis protein PhzF [Serinibacter arcticus]